MNKITIVWQILLYGTYFGFILSWGITLLVVQTVGAETLFKGKQLGLMLGYPFVAFVAPLLGFFPAMWAVITFPEKWTKKRIFIWFPLETIGVLLFSILLAFLASIAVFIYWAYSFIFVWRKEKCPIET